MIAAPEWDEWSAALPGRTFPTGKTWYPLYRGLGGPQGRSGRAKNLAPSGFDPRTVEPVVSSYTDWATQPKLSSSYIRLYSIVMDYQTTANWQECVSKWVWLVLVTILCLNRGLNSGPTWHFTRTLTTWLTFVCDRCLTPGRMRQAGHMVCVDKGRDAYRVLVRKTWE